MSDFTGKTLGQYRLETPLGRGGMATVYKAFQTSVKRYVAVKVMASDIANDPGFVERFQREAEVIAALEHPHILPVIDYGTDQNIHYLVMRYIEGGSLEDRMRRKTLTLEECSRLLGQMASALDYAHLRGVIHRDLKPNNVLLDASENAYLTDFGIARLMQGDSKLTATGAVMGTPAYMSPEQGMGRPVDARSDLYTLGVVLYEMVLNRLPFAAETPAALIFKHVYETPPPAQQVAPNLSDAISMVLDRAMQKNPDARYQSATDMANAFSEALGHRVVTPRPEVNTGVEGGTLVGGTDIAPVQPPQRGSGYVGDTMPPTQPPRVGTGTGGAVGQPPPGTPPVVHAPIISGPQPQQPQFQQAQPQYQAQPQLQGRKLPVGVIVAVVVVVLLLVAGGAFAVISTNANNTNQTNTAVFVAQGQTSTMAFILSATHTPTSTNTPTFTPTPTSTPNLTETLNAQIVATSFAAQTSTMVRQSTQTADANKSATAQAAFQATVTKQMLELQQTQESADKTETAKPTHTPSPTSTPTKRPPTARPAATRTPTPGPVTGFTGTPEDILGQLKDGGDLTSTSGDLIYQRATIDVVPDKPDQTSWNLIKSNVNVSDFVISAEVTWNSPDDTNGCGFIFRYSGDQGDSANFYVAWISRQGGFWAQAHDSSGFRSDAIKQEDNSLINVDDGATNQILLIGSGSEFRFYINGQLAETFSDSDFATGGIGAMATQSASSNSLTCHFNNLFAYELKKSLADSLISDNPDDVIQGLLADNVVSGTPKRLTLSKATASLTTSPKTFDDIAAATNKLTDMVISTDVTFNGSDSTSLYCGVFYNGTLPQTSAVTVFFNRDKKLFVYIAKDSSFKDTTKILDGVDAPSIKDGDTHRLTLVVVGNDATLYINGVQEQQWTDQTYKTGQVGYFIVNTSDDASLECDFANTAVWSLK